MLPSAALVSNARRQSPRLKPEQKEVIGMRGTKFQFGCALAIAFAILATLMPACSVNVKKEKNGEDKQVDINTPVGGIHVSKDANVDDVGLAVYPGAPRKPADSNGNDKS